MTENLSENLEAAETEASKHIIYEWLGMIASGEYLERNGIDREDSLKVQEIATEFERLLNEGHITIESKKYGRYLFACKNRSEESGKVRLILNVEPIVSVVSLGLLRGSEFQEREMMEDFIRDAMPRLVDHAKSLADHGLLI